MDFRSALASSPADRTSPRQILSLDRISFTPKTGKSTRKHDKATLSFHGVDKSSLPAGMTDDVDVDDDFRRPDIRSALAGWNSSPLPLLREDTNTRSSGDTESGVKGDEEEERRKVNQRLDEQRRELKMEMQEKNLKELLHRL